MIRISIKVKNDHCSFTEHFELTSLNLDVSDPLLLSMIEQTTKSFNQPIDEVIVKTKMEV